MVSFLAIKRPVVIDIIKKFAATIKYLRVCGGNATDLIEAISLVPNANHLELVLLQDFFHPPKKARHEIRNNDEEQLNLCQLKKLNIERSKHEFVGIFNGLAADMLNELTLHKNNLCNLTKLFKKQTKIKKLTIVNDDQFGYEESIIDVELFDNLKIEFLEWHGYSFGHNFRLVLEKQKNLTILKLIDGKIGEDVMNVITSQSSKLETLSISVPHIPIAAFKNITKLMNLKELTLQSNDDENVAHFEAFAALDNSRLTTFNIQYFYDIPNDLIAAMAKSLPNLKIVNFHCDNNVDTFHAIMKAFNYVEVLQLDTVNIDFNDIQKGNKSSLCKSGCANNRLIELKFLYPVSYTVTFVKKLVNDYPRLKKLIIRPTNNNMYKQFDIILKSFKELESLSILRNSTTLDRRMYDLDSIVEYGRKLKFVALLDIEIDMLDTQISDEIKLKFGVIKYSRIDGLKMAVDSKTMNIEADYIARC